MTFKNDIPTKFSNFVKFLYRFFPYAFMLLSSTAVGFSVSYQAIRATQKFLTLQSPYQLFFRTFITVGIGITGFLNTLGKKKHKLITKLSVILVDSYQNGLWTWPTKTFPIKH